MENAWKSVIGGMGLGLVGSMVWAVARLKPMTFEDADEKAEHVIDAEIDKTKTESKRKSLPQYVLAMLGRLRTTVATEIWEAYDRGKTIGKQEGRMEVIPELREFLVGQAQMAEERVKSGEGQAQWLAVAREFRAAAGVMNTRHHKG